MRVQILIDGQDYGDVVFGREVEPAPRRLGGDGHKVADHSTMKKVVNELAAQARSWVDKNIH